ncbi:RCC1 domain-containing protein [Nannocystis pusilla]|uniref:RCC1-like domain-containing protein n=1 Tax=Nannocystis pusilla TaxID=889268 RepID=A0ABS7TRD8_9BACT|nr:hypothetical protein [Nannocystis pusilla]MBZ5710793.1 hypothetical protein [Nannocystis pusilla]
MHATQRTISFNSFTLALAGALAGSACEEQILEQDTDAPLGDSSGRVEDESVEPATVTPGASAGLDEFAEPTVSNGACPANLARYVAVDASLGAHALALSEEGVVWAWGRNSRGQLGIGQINMFKNKPQQVTGIPTRVVGVAAGENHSLALDEYGKVWAWGEGSSGQLGGGSWSASPTPKQVTLSANVVAIAAGGAFSLALDDLGRVWAWGGNTYGQLGNGGTLNSSTPKLVTSTTGCGSFDAIAAGGEFAVALSGGQVCAWGRNNRGQLGSASPSYRATAAVVQGISGAFKVTAGKEYVIASAPGPTGWGDNSAGQLGKGDGAPSWYASPVSVGSGGFNFRHADTGSSHTLLGYGGGFSPQPPGLGFLSSAGSNGYGQLARTAPNPSRTFGSLQRIGSATAAGADFTLLIEGKTVKAAGKNTEGQLGDGTQVSTTLFTNVCLP